MNILQCEKVTKTYKMGQTTVTAVHPRIASMIPI